MENKKVAIIGAGITGLLTAISLKQKEPNAIIEIYEADTGYFSNRHQVIWKSGIKQLLSLGLGKRLSRITCQTVQINAINVENSTCFERLPGEHEVITPDPDDSCFIPPMIAVRECDLIRMLLTALRGRDDLVKSYELKIEMANNGPTVEEPVMGIEGDLAVGNWFEDEGFAEALPFINYGFELNSLRLSASLGTVSFCCTNEFGAKCDLLIACDGIHSDVRGLILNDRIKAQHTRQCLVTGISFISSVPEDSPTDTPKGFVVKHLLPEEIREKFPAGELTAYIENDITFGAIHLGNDMIGWRLLAPQLNPGALADTYIMPIRRAAISMSSAPIMHYSTQKLNIKRGSADEILTPSALAPPEVPEPPEPTPEPENHQQFYDPMGFYATGSESLNGVDSRNLALWILEEQKFPAHILSLISVSDVYQTMTEDNSDLYDEHTLQSYTCAHFHPGRVVILGDAAQTLARSAIGSHGLTFAINDACEYTKILSEQFRSNDHSSVKFDEIENVSDAVKLDQASRIFTDKRIANSRKAIADARYEATFVKTEPWFYQRFTGESKWFYKNMEAMQKLGS